MALIPCRECGKETSTDASSCPHCGAVVRKTPKAQGPGMGCAVALEVILLLAVVFSLVPKDHEAANAPSQNGEPAAREEANDDIARTKLSSLRIPNIWTR